MSWELFFSSCSNDESSTIPKLSTKEAVVVSVKDIYEKMHSAKKQLCWLVYRKPQPVVGHTGIVVKIDDSYYTIDYLAEGTKGAVLAGSAKGRATTSRMKYKELPREFMEKLSPLRFVQEIDLKEHEYTAMSLFRALIKEEKVSYDLVRSNCRHHVKRVVKRAQKVTDKCKLTPFKQPIEDILRGVTLLAFGKGGVPEERIQQAEEAVPTEERRLIAE